MLDFFRDNRAALLLAKFLAGGSCYILLEIAWRGYTHISMFFLGGLCFAALLRINSFNIHFCLKCLAGSLTITAGELATGLVVNIWLKLEVWDYSTEAWDIAGQICPRYFLLWCVLCGMVFGACGLVERVCGNFAAARNFFLSGGENRVMIKHK